MIVAYPSPHRIRRNFTLFPFAGVQNAPYPEDFMINTTMTQQNVDSLVNGYVGDFIGFQTYFESLPVSSTLLPLVPDRLDPFV